ncbi:MAG: response regulator [Myxococcales bacterium]|nr:response regulator [Myxococcales bacterium]
MFEGHPTAELEIGTGAKMVTTDGLRVLIVEDDGNSRESLAAALVDGGHQVSMASGAHSGVELLQTTEVDVIVTDLMMEAGDGFHMVAHGVARNVPVIVVSAFCGPEQRALAKARGAFDCLGKPIDLNELEATLLAAAASRR